MNPRQSFGLGAKCLDIHRGGGGGFKFSKLNNTWGSIFSRAAQSVLWGQKEFVLKGRSNSSSMKNQS